MLHKIGGTGKGKKPGSRRKTAAKKKKK